MMGSEEFRKSPEAFCTIKIGFGKASLRTFPHISQIDWLGAHHLLFSSFFLLTTTMRRVASRW